MGSWWGLGNFLPVYVRLPAFQQLSHTTDHVWPGSPHHLETWAFLSLLIKAEEGNFSLGKAWKWIFVTIAGYNATGQFFLFAVKVISGCRKIFTDLFWLPQKANLETRASKTVNIPFWHFRNEESLQKKTQFFCYPDCICLELKDSQGWKELYA